MKIVINDVTPKSINPVDLNGLYKDRDNDVWLIGEDTAVCFTGSGGFFSTHIDEEFNNSYGPFFPFNGTITLGGDE